MYLVKESNSIPAWISGVQLRPENAAGMTLFEAVEKMLGLKLEQQTRAIPVTVIDHVDNGRAEHGFILR